MSPGRRRVSAHAERALCSQPCGGPWRPVISGGGRAPAGCPAYSLGQWIGSSRGFPQPDRAQCAVRRLAAATASAAAIGTSSRKEPRARPGRASVGGEIMRPTRAHMNLRRSPKTHHQPTSLSRDPEPSCDPRQGCPAATPPRDSPEALSFTGPEASRRSGGRLVRRPRRRWCGRAPRPESPRSTDTR